MSLAQKRHWHFHMPLSAKLVCVLLLLTALVVGGGLVVLGRSTKSDVDVAAAAKHDEWKMAETTQIVVGHEYRRVLSDLQGKANVSFHDVSTAYLQARNYRDALKGEVIQPPSAQEVAEVNNAMKSLATAAAQTAQTQEQREMARGYYSQVFGPDAAKNRFPDVLTFEEKMKRSTLSP